MYLGLSNKDYDVEEVMLYEKAADIPIMGLLAAIRIESSELITLVVGL